MKKLERLYEGRSLTAIRGKTLEMATVRGYENNGVWVFVMEKNGRSGRESSMTTELREVMEFIKAFAPVTNWKLSKLIKPKREKKAKIVSGIKGRG